MDRDKSPIITASVIALVAIILIGAMLAPMLSTFKEDSSRTYTNSGLRVSPASGVTVSYDGGSDADINGSAVDTPLWWSYIVSSSIVVRSYSNSGTLCAQINALASDGSTLNQNYIDSFTLTMSGGSWTLTYTLSTESSESHSLSGTYEWLYIPDSSGAWVSYNTTSSLSPIYYADTSQIYAANYFYTIREFFYTLPSGVVYISGKDPSVLTVDSSSTDAAGVYSSAVSTSAGDITIATTDAMGDPYTIHPQVFVLPYQVTGVLTSEEGAVNLALAAVPLLIIAVLMIFVRIIQRED